MSTRPSYHACAVFLGNALHWRFNRVVIREPAPRDAPALLVAGAFAACALVACSTPSGPPVSSAPLADEPAPSVSSAPAAMVAAPTPSASAAGDEPKLAAEKPIDALAVAGFGEAVVSIPIGARERRPVVVAAHGNYNRPEGLCETWRTIVGDGAFVVCPRGKLRKDSPAPPDQRFTYDDGPALVREIDADLEALRLKFGAFVDEGAMIYVGFSLGAHLAPYVSSREPARFPYVIQIEGGTDRWVPDTLDKFSKGGGKRVLFVCAHPDCLDDVPFSISRLEAVGIKSEAVIGNPVGHRYDGSVAETTKGALAWLLDGDARFGRFP
jgi:hypothetical protein